MYKTHPHLEIARKVAYLMDAQFSLFGIKFGLDTIIGFIPGIGDLISLFFSCYLLWIGHQMNLPSASLMKMIWNLGLDTAIGAIPIIGDIGDLFFKANLKNLQILEDFDRAQRHQSKQVIEGEVVA